MKSFFTTLPKQKILAAIVFVLIGYAIGTRLVPTRDANFSWFGDLFSPRSQATADDEIVRVVSEESQVIEVVKKSVPAVVSIVASADVPIVERCYEEFGTGDPMLDDFFGLRIPSVCERGTQKQRVGAGTGFIVSSDGYILTNKHVVDNEQAEYTVILNDEAHSGKKVIARVVALDPSNDIAVLKIEETNLPYLEFGDSESLQVGQTAIAIGYALGEFDNTVSKGVVSGLLRSITAGSVFGQAEQLDGIIQTDAAINPGNSGGPLLDISGRVIGMNVAMAEAQNIGFALPINDVKKVFEDVKTTGRIQRAYLGVRYMVINEQFQKQNNLPYGYGALVVRGDTPTDLAVIPGSPADKAGIVENDIILEADGAKITESATLSRLIAKKKIGDTLKLKIFHKSEERTVDVVLAERSQ